MTGTVELLAASSAQRAIWFDERLTPGTVRHHVTTAVRLYAHGDPTLLRSALQRIVDSDPSLRTTFVEDDGKPLRRVTEYSEVVLEIIDASTWCSEEIDERLRQEHLRPYDLEEGPLVRFLLLSRSANEHILVIGMHHLITDLWSNAVLGHLIAATYQALANGEHPELELHATYTDFVEAERSMLTAAKSIETLEFWRPLYCGWVPQDLTFDHPGGDRVTAVGAVHHIDIDDDLAEALRRVAGERGSSVKSMVLAAYLATLHRDHGLDQVMVAEIKANRSVRDARSIGCFMNSVARSASFEPELTLDSLVGEVNRAQAETRPHERYPFAQLLHELRPGHGPSPFFAASFSWQKTSRVVAAGMAAKLALGESGGATDLEGFEVEPYAMPIRSAPLPLSLLAAGSGDRLELALEYQTERFESESIARFSRHLVTMLRAMVMVPESPVDDVELISEHEHASWRAEWEAAKQPVDHRMTVHALVEDQAARSPASIAVRDVKAQCTYGELDDRANRLAQHLRAVGVSRGDFVGICLDRTTDMVVTMLAVWKCGAAYVPLDPAFPQERLQVMVADASVAVVVSRTDVLATLSDGVHGDGWDLAGLSVVDLERDAGLIAGSSDSSPSVEVTGDDVAYVIFTSGSTGRPKGVVVNHGSVVNFLASMERRPGLGTTDLVLASTTLSFDISVLELCLPLVVGAEVLLVDRDVALDPSRLADAIRQVTVAQGTPTMWKMLIDAGWEGQQGLTVLCGGEPMSRALADELLRRCDVLWNMYGPTETTVWSAVARVAEGDGPVPLGEPIANTRFYVLNDGQFVADGTPGELWIAGRGVAQGYVGRPDLTEERFAVDPFYGDGDRMYRTGDRVRRGPRGDLEFLGRVDDQVKLRGHRIELGEIETALTRHASIADAVAAVWEYGVDDSRLVAYYVEAGRFDRAPDRGIADDVLREHLRASLPSYMIPAVFVPLDQIPLTPSNKVDRNRLPDPRLGRPVRATGGTTVAGAGADVSDDVVSTVLKIYRDVLSDDRIGANDNFFDLGGHSLLATRVASRLRHQLGRDVPLRAIFDHPTPGSLASVVAARPVFSDSRAGDRMIPGETIHVSEDENTFVLSHSQERMWFMQILHPDSVAYNLVAAMRVGGRVDPDALRWALDQLVERHTALRTSFFEDRGTPLLRVEAPFSPVLDVRDLTHVGDDGVRDDLVTSQLHELTRVPFDLSRLPLFRVVAFRLSDDDHVLGLVMHHIISDQWSFGVLSRELASLYEQRRLGLLSPVSSAITRPELYGHWRRTELDSESVERSLAYWRRQLANLPTLEIPTDRSRPETTSADGRTIIVTMPDELTAAVRAMARAENASEFMVLLAAFQVLVHRMTGAVDIPVGVPIANRQWLESESLITSLVNTLVIRTDLSGSVNFKDVVQRVRDVTLDAFEHQEVPFERLVHELAPTRDLSRSPLFQLFFNVQNAPFDMPSIDGLHFEVLQPERRAAQFDLSLTIDTAITNTLTLEYATALFDADRMQQFLDDYLAVVREGVMGNLSVVSLDRAASPGAGRLQGVEAPNQSPLVSRRTVSERPREGLERQLAGIWEDGLGVTGIGRNDDFFDLGGHSLLAVRIMAEVHRLTGRRPPMTVLFQAPTIAEFASVLESGGWLTPWTSLIEVRRSGTAAPLFYVSPFLISALSFHGLADELSGDVPFYVLQPQGLESDDPVHHRVEDMAAHYIREMKTVQPYGPYRIGGHCSGGWVAFEMARQLQAAGERVERLIIVDVEPPGIQPPRPKLTQYVVSRLVLYVGSGRLLDAVRWQLDLRRQLRRNRRIEGVNESRMRQLRAVHREAHRVYRGGSIDGRLVFIRSEEWSRLPDKGWHLGWSRLTSGGMDVDTVAGAHSALLHVANVGELGAAISGALRSG